MASQSQASFTTRLAWYAQTNPRTSPTTLRKTGIICTIGPKTCNTESLLALRDAGMNTVRMNFSHGSHEYHGNTVKTAREAFAKAPGRPVAIALDTKGPEIRTGLIAGEDIPFEAGHEMTFTTNAEYKEKGTKEILYIDYENLPKVISVGKIIYIDDGTMAFTVTSVSAEKGTVQVKAINAGKLASRKGVNLPNTVTDLPALSVQDRKDLTFGVEQGVDFIFASFIRKAADVHAIRSHLGEKGSRILIVSKIETWDGVDNFGEILEASDAIMVARGDLGIELPPEKVTIAQKMMIARCNIAGKPVICATQMLESMHTNPRPTRAEGSDVENAVLDGADCVMLSGETAKGAYPLESVSVMSKLCREAENIFFHSAHFNEIRSLTQHPTASPETAASSAVNASLEQSCAAIIVLSTTGQSAGFVSKYRPRIPILCVTRDAQTARQVSLYRGVYPYHYAREKVEGKSWQTDVDERLYWSMGQAKAAGMLKEGDNVVCLQGWKGGVGNTNTVRIMPVPQDLSSILKEAGF